MQKKIQEDTGVLQRAGIITVAGLGGVVAGYKGNQLSLDFSEWFYRYYGNVDSWDKDSNKTSQKDWKISRCQYIKTNIAWNYSANIQFHGLLMKILSRMNNQCHGNILMQSHEIHVDSGHANRCGSASVGLCFIRKKQPNFSSGVPFKSLRDKVFINSYWKYFLYSGYEILVIFVHFSVIGGIFRKAFLASAAMTTAAAVCYPNQAVDISNTAWARVKKETMSLYEDGKNKILL